MMRKLLIAWALLVTTCLVIPWDQLAQRLERWTCRRMGHRWVRDVQGEPVVDERWTCSRCGRFERV
jgi:hypothetical protein